MAKFFNVKTARWIPLACGFVIACLICDSAAAQQVSTNRGGTTTGARTTGGTSGTGSQIGGTSGTGTSALSTASGAGGVTGIGAAGITTGPAGFVGANTNQEFVGAGRQAVGNTNNNNRQFRAIQDTSMRGNTAMQQSGTPRQVPISLRVGFDLPSLNSVRGSLDAANNPSLSQFVSSRAEFSRIQVQVSTDGIATLSGTTNDAQSRRLAANLIRLQPGIRQIDNQLLVSGEQN